MTYHERAEKAYRDWQRALLKEADQPTLPTIHKFIVSEITAAVEEASHQAAWMQGQAVDEAYEDAAKIALTTPCPGRKGMNPIADVSHAIADAIRARAAEVGK